jgi:hypothetical protein
MVASRETECTALNSVAGSDRMLPVLYINAIPNVNRLFVFVIDLGSPDVVSAIVDALSHLHWAGHLGRA